MSKRYPDHALRTVFEVAIALLLTTALSFAQAKRLWVLRTSGEMVEYDLATFTVKQTVKLPPEAVKSPAALQMNPAGQILFAPVLSLPLSDEDLASTHKAWIWTGHALVSIDEGVQRKSETTGSNQAVTELAPSVSLSSDGSHLYWFGNESRRLQRQDVDLSISTTLKVWRTDLAGTGREDLLSAKLPDCRCPTGSCEESCPAGSLWAPERGVDKFFLINQSIAAQTGTVYKTTTEYNEDDGGWTPTPLPDPLQRVLDAGPSGTLIVEAIPDTGCCGWSNESDDQTLVLANGKKMVVFDEQETFRNSDYDVSFFTSNARLSPDQSQIAMTITSTAQADKPIQISEQGQANPEESQRIRKALTELPAVEVKTLDDPPKRVAFVPHAVLVGWINDKEALIVEDHLLVRYNAVSRARHKTSLRVEDASHVFLR